MSKFLKSVISAEEKMGEIISSHKLLKTAIVVEDAASKLKSFVLNKAVTGVVLLTTKFKK